MWIVYTRTYTEFVWGCTRGYTLGLCGVVHTFVWACTRGYTLGFVWGGAHVCVGVHAWIYTEFVWEWCTRGYTLGLCGNGVRVDIHWVCVGMVYAWIYTEFVWGGVRMDIHWVCVGMVYAWIYTGI